jgi:hypothetical protein
MHSVVAAAHQNATNSSAAAHHNATHSFAAAHGNASRGGAHASAHHDVSVHHWTVSDHRRSFSARRRGYVHVSQNYVATYMDEVRVQCEDGSTLEGVPGGPTYYTMQCSSDKTFTSYPGVCMPPRYPVTGKLSDAQAASRTLDGAEVRVLSTDGTELVDTTGSGRGGLYTVKLPVGTWTFEVKKDGYISTKKNVTVGGAIETGGPADMVLSQVLGEGEWRALVEWSKHTEDLDVHVFWNDNSAHVYWGRTSFQDYSSGISVSLDRDAVIGYGPESVTFAGIGSCTATSKCLVRFSIDNYTPFDGSIGDSEVHILLYKGSQLEKEFKVPSTVDVMDYHVFTLDARDGEGQVYDGKKKLPPFFQTGVPTDWSQSFDFPMWSWCKTGNVISGFSASSHQYLHDLDGISSVKVAATESLSCHEVAWDLSRLGWFTCPQGYFLEGLLRTGSRYMHGEGVAQITKASCCRPVEAPEEWGDCSDEPVFTYSGLQECSGGTGHLKAVAGLYRGNYSTELSDLDQMKCCGLPHMDLLDI